MKEQKNTLAHLLNQGAPDQFDDKAGGK